MSLSFFEERNHTPERSAILLFGARSLAALLKVPLDEDILLMAEVFFDEFLSWKEICEQIESDNLETWQHIYVEFSSGSWDTMTKFKHNGNSYWYDYETTETWEFWEDIRDIPEGIKYPIVINIGWDGHVCF